MREPKSSNRNNADRHRSIFTIITSDYNDKNMNNQNKNECKHVAHVTYIEFSDVLKIFFLKINVI